MRPEEGRKTAADSQKQLQHDESQKRRTEAAEKKEAAKETTARLDDYDRTPPPPTPEVLNKPVENGGSALVMVEAVHRWKDVSQATPAHHAHDEVAPPRAETKAPPGGGRRGRQDRIAFLQSMRKEASYHRGWRKWCRYVAEERRQKRELWLLQQLTHQVNDEIAFSKRLMHQWEIQNWKATEHGSPLKGGESDDVMMMRMLIENGSPEDEDLASPPESHIKRMARFKEEHDEVYVSPSYNAMRIIGAVAKETTDAAAILTGVNHRPHANGWEPGEVPSPALTPEWLADYDRTPPPPTPEVLNKPVVENGGSARLMSEAVHRWRDVSEATPASMTQQQRGVAAVLAVAEEEKEEEEKFSASIMRKMNEARLLTTAASPELSKKLSVNNPFRRELQQQQQNQSPQGRGRRGSLIEKQAAASTPNGRPNAAARFLRTAVPPASPAPRVYEYAPTNPFRQPARVSLHAAAALQAAQDTLGFSAQPSHHRRPTLGQRHRRHGGLPPRRERSGMASTLVH